MFHIFFIASFSLNCENENNLSTEENREKGSYKWLKSECSGKIKSTQSGAPPERRQYNTIKIIK